MVPLTTVIITKNEAANIEACIQSALLVSDDVIVVDCGSIDGTSLLATKAGATVISINWECYGHSRNTGAAAAKYEWILSLDADERVSPSLADTLHTIDLADESCIYTIKRENYFQNTKLKFGTLGFEKVARLYPRSKAKWDLVPVHERLQSDGRKKAIGERIIHFGITDKQEHRRKKEYYALLSAHKYLQQNKKATLLKRFMSPVFNGLKSYVFQLGFLDGKKGWEVATVITYYTWLKYKYLHELTYRPHSFTPQAVLHNTSSFEGAANSFSLKR